MLIAKKQRKPVQRQAGFSLLELMVVLTILMATALIVLPLFNDVKITKPTGEKESAVQIATEATMVNVRDAMVRENGVLESLFHKPNALPRKIKELVKAEAPDHIQQEAPELKDYDPVNRIGWCGPYMHPTGKNEFGEPTLVDGWGNELELQVDFDENGKVDQTESQYIRIVSAGPNGKIETPGNQENMKPGKDELNELTRSECGDDLVVFIRIPDDR